MYINSTNIWNLRFFVQKQIAGRTLVNEFKSKMSETLRDEGSRSEDRWYDMMM